MEPVLQPKNFLDRGRATRTLIEDSHAKPRTNHGPAGSNPRRADAFSCGGAKRRVYLRRGKRTPAPSEKLCRLNQADRRETSKAMGLTRVTTKLTNIESPEKSYRICFLVNTGATDSLAPADELEKLGMRKRESIVRAGGRDCQGIRVWPGTHRIHGRNNRWSRDFWRTRLGTSVGSDGPRVGGHHGRSGQQNAQTPARNPA